MATKKDEQPGTTTADTAPVSTPPVEPVATDAADMKMTADEFAEMRQSASLIAMQDFHLGQFLQMLVRHLGHAHGLDTAAEDARLAAEARAAKRQEEDDRLKSEAEDRKRVRLAQDAQARTPEQYAVLQAARDEEEAQLETDAKALAAKRAEEDAATEAAAKEAHNAS